VATLFVLSHTPHSDPFDAKTLSLAREGDTVLLIEDAVYAAAPARTSLSDALAESQERGAKFLALAPDVAARGVVSQMPTVDYAGFVALIMDHDRVMH
jgi:tRNA 2-thiouridine synthesizing protein B